MVKQDKVMYLLARLWLLASAAADEGEEAAGAAKEEGGRESCDVCMCREMIEVLGAVVCVRAKRRDTSGQGEQIHHIFPFPHNTSWLHVHNTTHRSPVYSAAGRCCPGWPPASASARQGGVRSGRGPARSFRRGAIVGWVDD